MEYRSCPLRVLLISDVSLTSNFWRKPIVAGQFYSQGETAVDVRPLFSSVHLWGIESWDAISSGCGPISLWKEKKFKGNRQPSGVLVYYWCHEKIDQTLWLTIHASTPVHLLYASFFKRSEGDRFVQVYSRPFTQNPTQVCMFYPIVQACLCGGANLNQRTCACTEVSFKSWDCNLMKKRRCNIFDGRLWKMKNLILSHKGCLAFSTKDHGKCSDPKWHQLRNLIFLLCMNLMQCSEGTSNSVFIFHEEWWTCWTLSRTSFSLSRFYFSVKCFNCRVMDLFGLSHILSLLRFYSSVECSRVFLYSRKPPRNDVNWGEVYSRDGEPVRIEQYTL